MPRPILFCHGLESAPIGRKSQGLLDLGYEVRAPDCRGKDLDERVAILFAALRGVEPKPVVVGSSFGGIAALLATIAATRDGAVIPGLVLCAPALQWADPSAELVPPCETVIVHGTRDEVIPIAHSRDYARAHGVPLIEVDDTHGLPDAGFAAITNEVRRLCAITP